PGNGFSFLTYLAIWVATHNPIFPWRMASKDTVLLALSGLSDIPFSLSLISATLLVKSLFHSKAFIAKSKWASNTNILLILSHHRSQPLLIGPFTGRFIYLS